MRVDSASKLQRIDAQVLIPGRGSPISNGTLIFCEKKITFVGETSKLPTKYQEISPIEVPILMPGLWDCHVHLCGSARYSLGDVASTHMAVAGARCARDVVAMLNAGFTSVRELAGYGVQLATVIDEGWLPGPNIYSSVSMLSTTSGHGDVRGIPLDVLWGKIENGTPLYLCDGFNECIKGVRVQIRKGAKVIKLAASGGIVSEGDDAFAQQFSDEELAAIVDEASRNNLLVAAHCHANKAILAAIKAGCRTIEHATLIEDDAIQLMVEKDVLLIATRGIVKFGAEHPEMWSPEQYANICKINKQHAEGYRKAVKAGVRIAIGTDMLLNSFKLPWGYGMNGVELKYAVEAGMTPLQAIDAATANGPASLGPKAPNSGLLKEGFDADFIGLDKNPLEDIEILGDAKNIIHVWKGVE
ncbi:hypothetical protein HYFRA_00000193 [Hymenoscyphus fraxineus]|uniref:Amidohydrolase-related domain-containing protein n=1 Tax=Hymenoscyphus fraxineus TaxID=746836 RepID=A0A9N9L488_9HELO|nr:hypothetical protein HYFRA_00000193 [Hymenoscyphus fraxineus]